MKNVSIYLESDSTAFQKKKRICGYVLEYIKKKRGCRDKGRVPGGRRYLPPGDSENSGRSAWAHPGTMYHLHLQPGRLCLQHAHQKATRMGGQRFYFQRKADCQPGGVARCMGKDKHT